MRRNACCFWTLCWWREQRAPLEMVGGRGDVSAVVGETLPGFRPQGLRKKGQSRVKRTEISLNH